MEAQTLPAIEIPLEKLTPDVLRSIIENFILREGTDYGAEEVSLETKIEQINKQLKRKEIKVIFDPNTETVSLTTKRDWAKQKKG